MEYHTSLFQVAQLVWWFQYVLFSTRKLGTWSNLTNIFQMGWNHQLVKCLYLSIALTWVDGDFFMSGLLSPLKILELLKLTPKSQHWCHCRNGCFSKNNFANKTWKRFEGMNIWPLSKEVSEIQREDPSTSSNSFCWQWLFVFPFFGQFP